MASIDLQSTKFEDIGYFTHCSTGVPMLAFTLFCLTGPETKQPEIFFLVSMGMLATLISSVLDHARTDFSNPWLWIPTAAGILGTVMPLFIGFLKKPIRSDIWTYIGTMLAIILVGTLGSVLHILSNLSTENVIVGERFVRGAPMLAPLLFAEIATLGLFILLDPDETPKLKEYVHLTGQVQ